MTYYLAHINTIALPVFFCISAKLFPAKIGGEPIDAGGTLKEGQLDGRIMLQSIPCRWWNRLGEAIGDRVDGSYSYQLT